MLSPSRYRICAVGKVKKPWIQDGINSYMKRLPGLTITEIRDSNPKKEACSISSSLRKNEFLIALTEEADTISSVDLASRLQKLENHRLVFLVGGANGLYSDIKESANWQLSLSPLTFPHEIARLLLIEQLYRAHAILQGSPYHRQ